MTILVPGTKDWANREKLILFPETEFEVKQGHVSISNLELKTTGLYTCCAVAAVYNGVNFLSHVDAKTSTYFLKDCLLGAFEGLELESNPDFKVEILNGNQISQHAMGVVRRAIQLAGLEQYLLQREEFELLTMLDVVQVCGSVSFTKGLSGT